MFEIFICIIKFMDSITNQLNEIKKIIMNIEKSFKLPDKEKVKNCHNAIRTIY